MEENFVKKIVMEITLLNLNDDKILLGEIIFNGPGYDQINIGIRFHQEKILLAGPLSEKNEYKFLPPGMRNFIR